MERSLNSPAHKYALDIVNGKVKTTKYVLLACLRYLNDLYYTAADKGYYFNTSKAWHAIDFFHDYLVHWKGSAAGKPFILEPWQQFIIWNLFGWEDEEGYRRFQTAYVEVPRKNGKSPLGAGIILYCGLADGEGGAEVYTVATKLAQAQISFNYAKNMLKRSVELRKQCTIYTNNISIPHTDSFITAVGADHKTMDGFNTHCALIDELHAHPDGGVVDVITTSTGARKQPLVFKITTAGNNVFSVCWEYRDYSTKVLQDLEGFQDESWFSMIFGLEELKENPEVWKDPEMWAIANPNYGVSLEKKYMAREFKKAIAIESYRGSFQRLNTGIWTSAGTKWIPPEKWKNCRAKNKEGLELDLFELLKGKEAFGGLDLAKNMDINAYCLFFPDDDSSISKISGKLLTFFFCPEDVIKERSENKLTPYEKWSDLGFLIATSGNVRDDDFIINYILDLHNIFNIQSTAYDNWEATNIAAKLQAENVEMNEFRQGYKSMNQPVKQFEMMVYAKRLSHDGNPVMSWMMENVIITTDPAENRKINKEKSKKKVDGPVSAVMAVGEYMAFNPPYEIPDNIITHI